MRVRERRPVHHRMVFLAAKGSTAAYVAAAIGAALTAIVGGH